MPSHTTTATTASGSTRNRRKFNIKGNNSVTHRLISFLLLVIALALLVHSLKLLLFGSAKMGGVSHNVPRELQSNFDALERWCQRSDGQGCKYHNEQTLRSVEERRQFQSLYQINTQVSEDRYPLDYQLDHLLQSLES